MGRERVICGFLATPRMDGNTNGLIRKYEFYVSSDGETWNLVSSGDWLPYCTEVNFTKNTCRYIRLVSKEGDYASLAELDVVIDKNTETGIEQVEEPDYTEKQVVSRTFYSIDGRQITEPTNGIIIEKIIYSDGTIKSVKRICNE